MQGAVMRKRLSVILAVVTLCGFASGIVVSSSVLIDVTRLPLGDGHVSTAPERGAVWSCQQRFNGGGAFRDGAWIHDDGTWDATAKISVDGAVSWPNAVFTITRDGDQRIVSGNGLPTSQTTGIFPISPSDPAFRYDRNPNNIRMQQVWYVLPANPTLAAQPSCVPMGPIGITLTGVPLFNALDATGRDAAAHEIQDGCQGHPERTGMYHYHTLSQCIDDSGTGASGLIGYALDGFGIYGYRGPDGHEVTNADLDECHGRVDEIDWDGQRVLMYHYQATREYPYTIGCFRGTPVTATR